jgi:hypothetical protein
MLFDGLRYELHTTFPAQRTMSKTIERICMSQTQREWSLPCQNKGSHKYEVKSRFVRETGHVSDCSCVNQAVDNNEHCHSTSLFQFPIFADSLSVGHGLKANIQNAMKFSPGSNASKHHIT